MREATGVTVEAVPQPAEGRPRPRRSLSGSIIGAAMLGLERAIYGVIRDEPAIVLEDDEPEGDEIELHLDPDDPRKSWVRFAPGSRAAFEEPTTEEWRNGQ